MFWNSKCITHIKQNFATIAFNLVGEDTAESLKEIVT